MMKAALKISWPSGSRREHRQDGKQQRHRAAQAHPGDEGGLFAMKAERRQRQPYRRRPPHEDEEQGDRQALYRDARKLRRRSKQAEHHEHADLRQPRHAVLKAAQRHRLAQLAVSRHQAAT